LTIALQWFIFVELNKMVMTAEEFFNQQATTDAASVIDPNQTNYTRFDLIRFARSFRDNTGWTTEKPTLTEPCMLLCGDKWEQFDEWNFDVYRYENGYLICENTTMWELSELPDYKYYIVLPLIET